MFVNLSFFAYKYLKINFNPLVCCCMKPFMRARKNRRGVAEDSGEEGNFCCSNIGPLIAESGNMIPGTCKLGHNFFGYWTQPVSYTHLTLPTSDLV